MSGKKATSNIIPGKYALSVGKPDLNLPKQWSWIKLEDIATLATGHTPSRKFPEYWNGDIPWMAVGDARKYNGKKIYSTKEFTNELGIKNSAAVVLPENTVCLSRTASIGYSIILGKPMATSQGFVNWICSEYLSPRYLQCIFLIEKQFLYEISEGTAHTTIYFPEVKAFHIALPPPTEQIRIVEKLDALLGQLESLKSSMANVPLLLKDFRQQVLNQAVTGKLTKDWREGKELENVFIEINNLDSNIFLKTTLKPLETKFNVPKKWEWYNLNYLCSKITDGEHITPELASKGIPLLSAKDVRTNFLDFSDVKFVNEIIATKSRTRCNPEKGDILVVSRGATVGRSTIVNVDKIFCLMGSVLLFKPLIKYIDSKYLEYYFKSSYGLEDIISRSGATAQQAVYIRDMKEFGIPLPPLQEQQEIVTRVESLFNKADAIEKQYESLKVKIDNLPQALLYKAFKGELTEQLASDGDARELLKEIEALKNNAKSKSKEYKVPKEKLRLVAETK